MANLGYVSTFNINGNELTLKDAALTEIVSEIIEAIGANNTNIAERINDLHNRSFDNTIKISSQNESEIASIQDGLYKIQYVTVTGEGDNATETLNNSAILIQKGTNQYLYKDGQLSSRVKTDSTWGNWITFEGGVTSVNGMTGAVTVKENTQADWDATSGDAVILNKPKIENVYRDIGSSTIFGTKINGNTGEFISLMDGIAISNSNYDSANIKLGYHAADNDTITLTSRGSDGGVYVNTDEPFMYNNKEVATVDQIVTPPVTSVNGMTGAVTITETQLSKGTATGTGNAVTDINVSNHQITLVKGAIYTTQEDVNQSIAALVDSAPETLNTLNELAEALGNDENFATTVATQIGQKYTKPSTGIPASDLAAGVIPDVPVQSVNGMTGAVTINVPVTSVNGQTGAVTVNVGVTSFNGSTGAVTYTAPVTSVNGMTGAVIIPDAKISSNYATSTDTNDDLLLAAGDTYEEAFGKLEKAILDNSEVAATAIQEVASSSSTAIQEIASNMVTSVNGQTGDVTITIPEGQLSSDYAMSTATNEDLELASGDTYEEAFGKLEKAIIDNELVVTAAITDLDSRVTDTESLATVAKSGSYNDLTNRPTIPTKTSDLTNDSGFLTQAPVTSVNSKTGAVTIKENVQADWNATTGDAVILNKPTIPAAVTESTVAGWGFTKNTGTLTTETQLSKGTATGTGNAVTDINVSNHQITLVKGKTFLETAPVTSVNNQTGDVTLALGDTNVIETVKVNNTALTPVSKAVNITVPTKTSDLTNDSNFTSNTGTITGITMNGVSKGTSGIVNLGTVLTEHQDISGKVDKVTGMGLSSNDYTTTEKNKLAGINIGSLDNLTTAELNSIFATS